MTHTHYIVDPGKQTATAKAQMEKPQYGSTPMAHDRYNEHVASLPTIHLSPELSEIVSEGQSLEVGKDIRLEYQVKSMETSEWVDTIKGQYLSRYETGRRILAYPLNRLKEVVGSFPDFPLPQSSKPEATGGENYQHRGAVQSMLWQLIDDWQDCTGSDCKEKFDKIVDYAMSLVPYPIKSAPPVGVEGLAKELSEELFGKHCHPDYEDPITYVSLDDANIVLNKAIAAHSDAVELLESCKKTFEWLDAIGGKGLREHGEMRKRLDEINDFLKNKK